MTLIRKSNELTIPTTVKMMIYGQAGMGKSTVALSAPSPTSYRSPGGKRCRKYSEKTSRPTRRS